MESTNQRIRQFGRGRRLAVVNIDVENHNEDTEDFQAALLTYISFLRITYEQLIACKNIYNDEQYVTEEQLQISIEEDMNARVPLKHFRDYSEDNFRHLVGQRRMTVDTWLEKLKQLLGLIENSKFKTSKDFADEWLEDKIRFSKAMLASALRQVTPFIESCP